MDRDVALIGFGEAGRTFAESARWGLRACAFDRKTDSAETREDQLAVYRVAGVVPADTVAAAVTAPVLVSLVTADQALAAARSVAGLGLGGAWYFDGNSVAPETKRRAAEAIERAGGRYVDMAIMAPVHPARLDVPILLSGEQASEAQAVLRALGFRAVRMVGEHVGRASAIKMIRSVIVKGIEALTAECVLAASRADVLDEVLASLDASERATAWHDRADYSLDRMLVHGLRRAAEMEEVSSTLADLGIEPDMTRGTIVYQRALGMFGATRPGAGLQAKLDIIENRGAKAA